MQRLLALSLIVAAFACGKGKDSKDKPADRPADPPPVAVDAGSGSSAMTPPAQPKPYTPKADTSDAIKAVIADPDRADADRALDAGRMPGEVFTFFKIAPGQKIGELFAGGGYSTEMLARIVGKGGKVWAQNSKEIMDRFARKPIEERLKKSALANVTLLERAADDPFSTEVKDLDAVICILNYHDFVWQKVDLAKLNAAVFKVLKPGGVYAIIDHSAAAGSGTRDVETLHRIDEEVVKADVAKAGFTLDASSDVLRNPDDKRDWNSSPKAAGDRRGTSDRFTLRFVKPAK
ncbi:MAG: SAM-dependent methyltransferase [Kofleriaceae bacterium]